MQSYSRWFGDKWLMTINIETERLNMIFTKLPISIFSTEKEMCQREEKVPMMGELVCCNSVTSLRTIHGNEFDKWILPPYLLDDFIPEYINGPSILIPQWVIPCLATALWQVPITPLDDMYTSGFLAEACNISRVELSYFNGQPWPIPGPYWFKKITARPIHIIYHLGKHHLATKVKYNLHKKYMKIYQINLTRKHWKFLLSKTFIYI